MSSFEKIVVSKTREDFIEQLEIFNKLNEDQFNFNNVPSIFMDLVLSYLKELRESDVNTLLGTLRLLSRDKTSNFNTEIIEIIRNLIIDGINDEIIINALKCLTNIMFNNRETSRLLEEQLNLSLDLVKKFLHIDDFLEKKHFQRNSLIIKSLFIQTVYNEDQIKVLNNVKVMDFLLETADKLMSQTFNMTFDSNQASLLIEILKLMYNLTLNQCFEHDQDHMVGILRDLLLFQTQDETKKDILTGNIVNLLTNMRSSSYIHLIIDLKNPFETQNRLFKLNVRPLIIRDDALFANYFCLSLKILVDYLGNCLCAYFKDKNLACLDTLQPILLCLYLIAKSNRYLRKYLRAKILPPLSGDDIYRLPSEGTKPRNYLARLMTHVNTQIKRLSAQLLFTLCNESTSRLVKYTGFGNSAGLITDLGLLASRVDCANDDSDDSDSDTEDYKKAKDHINHVKGCFDSQLNENIFDGCTEEQKMYVVDQLMSKFDKMNRMGLIRPAVFDEASGKPKAVEHVLEFIEKNAQNTNKNESDDEDLVP